MNAIKTEVDSNQRFCLGALSQKFQVFVKNFLYLSQNHFHIEFFLCSIKSQPNWAKDKGTRISPSNDTENCLMMLNTNFMVMTPAKFVVRFRGFFRHAKLIGHWTTNKRETQIAQLE